ncbi:MAG: bis(5'-nucleosyl)-tetraphosphatase (symmetrical) YqeK [Firmicutes bacterium]|nr:bis(5'-nucleosyl)-tetraphosphatase (symmetrical) YqeK [Bacillota bacterium]
MQNKTKNSVFDKENARVKGGVMMNIAIFGGTMDPFHCGHLQIVEHLCDLFDLVLLVPNNVSPFKGEELLVDKEIRYQMLCLQVERMRAQNAQRGDKICIERCEMDREPPSYTIDTLLYLKKKHPKDGLYLCLGSDAYEGFAGWKDSQKILELCNLLLVPRQGASVDCEGVPVFEGGHQKLSKLGVPILQVSSSEARVDIAFGCFDKLPPVIAKSIQEQNLYADYAGIVKQYPSYGLSEGRIGHIHRVAQTALQIALNVHGVVRHKVVMAALLHDIAKRTPQAQIVLTKQQEKFLLALSPNIVHAFLGAEIAQQKFGVSDLDVLNAIRHHTTGRAEMSDLEKIIYLADMVEPRRTMPGVESVRDLALNGRLDEAMCIGLGQTIDNLRMRGEKIDARTTQAYAHFQRLTQAK